jgi:hypothetical protein
MKRGQGIQFNWIFVAIAGAIFLVFFGFFGMRYFGLEQSKENAKIVRAVDSAIFSGKGLNQYKEEFGEGFPKFSLSYDCERIYVNDDQSLGLEHVVFMESNLENPLSLWSYKYERPYLIDSVVYVWDSGKKFYLDDSLPEEFIENLPSGLKTSDRGGADVLVYYGNANPVEGKKVIAFTDRFVGFVNEDKYFSYNGDYAFVYGAMFSDVDSFECSKELLEEREESMRSLYLKKLDYLGSRCNEYGLLRDAIRRGDVDSIESLNINLDNKGCEVLF